MKLFDTIAIEQESVDLNRLELYLPSVAQEGMLDDIIERVSSVFNPLRNLFAKYTVEYTADQDRVMVDTLANIDKYIKILKKTDEKYIVTKIMDEVNKVIIGVPNGFNSRLNRFIPDLLTDSQQMQSFALIELEKFNSVISNYITNKESRKNVRLFNSEINVIKKTNDKILSDINSHFKHTSKDSGTTYIKNIIDGYRDLVKLEIPIMKLGKVNEFKNISTAQTSIQKTVDLLDIFLNEIKTEETIDAEYLKSLTIYTRELARLFETYSAIRLYSEFSVKIYANVVSTIISKL